MLALAGERNITILTERQYWLLTFSSQQAAPPLQEGGEGPGTGSKTKEFEDLAAVPFPGSGGKMIYVVFDELGLLSRSQMACSSNSEGLIVYLNRIVHRFASVEYPGDVDEGTDSRRCSITLSCLIFPRRTLDQLSRT